MHIHAPTRTLSCVCNSLYFIQYLISLPRTEKANARVSRTAWQAQGTFHSATGLRPLPCSLVLSCIVMCSVVVCVCVLQIKSIESTACHHPFLPGVNELHNNTVMWKGSSELGIALGCKQKVALSHKGSLWCRCRLAGVSLIPWTRNQMK